MFGQRSSIARAVQDANDDQFPVTMQVVDHEVSGEPRSQARSELLSGGTGEREVAEGGACISDPGN